MASSYPVKSVEVCKVCPASSSCSQTSLSLLFFDLFWLRFPPNQRVFFYQYPHETTTLLAKLKTSLSLTLDHYLPLAGNLMWNNNTRKPSIEYYAGDGISLIVAESESDFDLLCSDSFREAKLFYPLLPELCTTSSNTVPVISLQVTLFPNKGFSIGFSVHHRVMDGKTFSMFIHSWASICRENILREDFVPVFDRDIVKVPPHLDGIFLKHLLEEKGTNNKSLEMWDIKAPSGILFGTFRLKYSDIEKLKKWVRSQLEKEHEHNLYISTFTITSAFMLVCLFRTHKIASGKVHLVFSVDSRSRLDPALPSNYFGNCISACFLDVSTAAFINGNGVTVAAKAISEALKNLEGKILDGAENWIYELSTNVQRDSVYSIAGSPHFELYKADFGWGKPRKVDMISIGKSGAFYLSDDRDGNGGIEIGVVLKEDEVEDFVSIFASVLRSVNW